MLKIVIPAAALAVAAATPALAIEVVKTVDIAAPPEAVWKTIGEFCGIADWHPAIEKCELSDKGGKPQRTLTLKGGGTIVEQQLGRSDKKMTYGYTILESPLPVASYKSSISVAKEGSGSKVTWKGGFKAKKGTPDDKAQEAIAGIYDAGLKSLSEKAK